MRINGDFYLFYFVLLHFKHPIENRSTPPHNWQFSCGNANFFLTSPFNPLIVKMIYDTRCCSIGMWKRFLSCRFRTRFFIVIGFPHQEGVASAAASAQFWFLTFLLLRQQFVRCKCSLFLGGVSRERSVFTVVAVKMWISWVWNVV